MKKVGIIGCGNISHVHARVLEVIDTAELVAVCDIRSDRLTGFGEGIATFTDYKVMIRSGLVDAVHICTPHHLHAEMAIFALENGVDVLCEKPMAITLADARRMADTAKQNGRKLWVVFQNRFNAGSMLIRNAVTSGKLGKVLGAKCEVTWHRDMHYYHDDWHGRLSTEGGGVVINQAIHTLDLMRWLVNAPVAAVDATIRNRTLPELDVEDTAEGLVTFESGIRGNFYFTNTYAADSPVRLELVCEKGCAVLECMDGTVKFADGEVLTASDNDEIMLGGKAYWGNSHLRQIQAFYENAASDYENLCEALHTQELMCAVYASARENRKIEL